MGLKYQMFVTNIPAKQLFNQLLKSDGIDETELMMKDRDFDDKQLNDLKNIHNLKISKDEQYKVFMETINREPDDKKLAEYRKRKIDDDIVYFSIYFMSLPSNKNFTFGSFYYLTFFIERYYALVAEVFYKAQISEWIFQGYAHTSNEGNVIFIKPIKDDLDVTGFPIWKNERERFEKYAKRIENKIKYPIMEVHNYIDDNGYQPLHWEYQVAFPLKRKEK